MYQKLNRCSLRGGWGFSSRILAIATLLIFFGNKRAESFTIAIHRNITTETLRSMTVAVAGQTKSFSDRALDQIANANQAIDDKTPALAFPAGHFTDERFVDSSTRLINLRNQIVMSLTADPPNGDQARTLLGGALHTVQDFYAHSTWVELGNSGINSDLGRNVMPNPSATLQPCPDPNSVTQVGLSSGYVIAGSILDPKHLGCGTLPSAGKCYHGNYTIYCVGMNKDCDTTCSPPWYLPYPGSPPSPLHAAARNLAEQATQDYVNQILSAVSGNDKAVSALLDIKGSIGFVIDDTGSMGDEIDGVKIVVEGIVRTLDLFPLSRPDNWLLERFGDPDFGPAFVTDSADELLNAVDALYAHGGGDCPELAQNGLLEAIDRSFPNSRLFLFTDADAKDSSLVNVVISRAQEKGINIIYALTGSCSPIDPAYIRGATETGGQLFFITPSEVSLLSDLLQPQLSGDLVTILTANGSFTGTQQTFDIPVDSTVRRLVVSTSMDTKADVSLRRPSGEVVNPSDPDAHITPLTSGCIVTIDSPGSGGWVVEISGSGNFSVVVQGNSPIEFRRFDFVEPNQDIHGGFFPIPGQPLAGANVTGEATLLGPLTAGSFKLVSENGTLIKNISLYQNYSNAAPDHFLGEFTLPAEPFRVVATGKDTNGFEFQRQFATIYRGQGVELRATETNIVSLIPGVPTNISFAVHNLGTTGVFNITVTATPGTILSVAPSSLLLGTDELGGVIAQIVVAVGVPGGTPVSITAVAVRADDPTINNSATILANVVSFNKPPVADASATVTNFVSSNNTNATVILDGSRSYDTDGDPLQFSWFEAGSVTPFASGMVATNTFTIGPHSLVLQVSDGIATDADSITVEVVTPCHAVQDILSVVNAASIPGERKGPLAATLQAACRSFDGHLDAHNMGAGANQLVAFENQVRAQISPLDDMLALSLVNAAQQIVEVVGVRLPRFTSMGRKSGGSFWVEFIALGGQAYTIQASTNLLNWETVGVVIENLNGWFEFEDSSAPTYQSRFYRIAPP